MWDSVDDNRGTVVPMHFHEQVRRLIYLGYREIEELSNPSFNDDFLSEVTRLASNALTFSPLRPLTFRSNIFFWHQLYRLINASMSLTNIVPH